jgi:heme exporter protein A
MISSEGCALLSARGLVKRYGHQRALRKLDLDIQPGEFVTVFGPNGAGKTTLLRLFAGLARPSGGSLNFEGRPLAGELQRLRGRLGHVSHASMLYSSLSARENLLFAGRLQGVEQLHSRIDELLRTMELQERADDPVRTLSRGLLQRVSVARALLHDPDVILLDEPFSGLDPHASRVLRTLLEAVRNRDRTVLLVTHDLARGLELADRVLILDRGRLVHDASVEEGTVLDFEQTYLRCLAGEGAA